MQFVESVDYGQEESRLNSDRLGFGLASVVTSKCGKIRGQCIK